MTLKFYLHNAATSDTGTLPGAGVSVSATTPSQIVSGTNRAMNGTIGVFQASGLLTTLANTNPQPSLIHRFLSDPIAAQTIASQLVSVKLGVAESNLNSNVHLVAIVAVWRPSDGSIVGRIWDGGGSSTAEPAVAATEESQNTSLNGTTSVVAADGDVIVCEVWRDSTIQAMATAYTNTAFYDGTVEGSASDNAAYLLFANDVAMFTAPARVPYTNPMPQLLAQARAYERRRRFAFLDGLWRPDRRLVPA